MSFRRHLHLFIALLAAPPLEAQTPPSPRRQSPPSVEMTLAELRKLVERQQLLEAQSKLLAFDQKIAGLKKQVDDAGAGALRAERGRDLKKQPAAATVPDAVAERLAEVEKARSAVRSDRL